MEDEAMSDWAKLKADVALLNDHGRELHSKDQDFAFSLCEQFEARGLSAKQEYWVGVLADRVRERQARANQPQAKPVNLDGVLALFRAAKSKGLKAPRLLVDGGDAGLLRITVSGVNSRYHGQLSITDTASYEGRTWFGRVDLQGVYHPSQAGKVCQTAIQAALVALAQDPAKAATLYGKRHGVCCFCARTLTDERSVTAGYGPVCADKWGLDWGSVDKAVTEEKVEIERPSTLGRRCSGSFPQLSKAQPAVPFDDEIPF